MSRDELPVTLPMSNPLGATSGPLLNSLEASAEVPARIGPYEVLGVLGQGGMGIVVKARHAQLDRIVAIKSLIAGEDASLEAVARFLGEAQTLARLDTHPNIVKVLDAGRDGGRAYMVMEFVEGTDLKNLIAAGMVKSRPAARVVADIAGALALAHEKGVIHRDIKPANILIDKASRARLTDFGIAKLGEGEGGHTMTGAVLGTIPYMAPEQAEDSKQVDERTDVYGLGAVLYECLTGRPPHIGSSPMNILSSLLTREPPRPRSLNPEVDEALEVICLKALAKDPAKRYQSCLELQAALEDYRHGDESVLDLIIEQDRSLPRPARRPRPLALIASVLLNLALLLALGLTLRPPPAAPAPKALPASTAPSAAPPPLAVALRDGPQGILRYGPEAGPQTLTWRLTMTPPEAAGEALFALCDGSALCRFLTLAEEEDGLIARLTLSPEDGASWSLRGGAAGDPRSLPELASLTWQLDDEGPTLVLDEGWAPRQGALITLTGAVTDPSGVTLRLDGPDEMGPASTSLDGPDEEGRFRCSLSLAPGERRQLRFIAADALGNETRRELELAGPEPASAELHLSLEPLPELTTESEVTLRGRLEPAEAALQLEVDGEAHEVEVRDGAWSLALELSEGAHRVVARATHAGAEQRAEAALTVDLTAPVAELEGASDGLLEWLGEPAELRLRWSEPVTELVIALRAGEESWQEVARLGEAITEVWEGSIEGLEPGAYGLRAQARDLAGNSSEAEFALRRPEVPPAILEVEVKPEKVTSRVEVTVHEDVTALTINGKPTTVINGERVARLPSAELTRGLVIVAERRVGEERLELEAAPRLLSHLDAWSVAQETTRGRATLQLTVGVLGVELAEGYEFAGWSRPTAGPESILIASFTHRATGILMRLVPGFAYDDEVPEKPEEGSPLKPIHRRFAPMLMAAREVTRKQADELLKTSAIIAPRRATSGQALTGVSYAGVAAWLEGMNARSKGPGLALPTFHQWLYAAYAALDGRPWGDDLKAAEAYGHFGAGPASASDRRRPNRFGLEDVLGNAREWIIDHEVMWTEQSYSKVFEEFLDGRRLVESWRPLLIKETDHHLSVGPGFDTSRDSSGGHIPALDLNHTSWVQDVPFPLEAEALSAVRRDRREDFDSLGFRPCVVLPWLD